ncbi:putative F-box protein At3g10430 [Lotus japonicus]|uniref:putative F-box protein At3g10430 n=1 Tax=Lotus japonicus TaxID=34305 RepID=UPI00258EF92C|nr:putative F-box protein At3g10430 [Lotus japonicus]
MANEKTNPTLPHELIAEILLRLPVRSLLRFKCVCTSWFFLISDPQFAESHFDLNAAPTHRLLLPCLDKNKLESLDLESSSLFVTLNLPPPCKSRDHNSLYFLGSCRGFMLLAYDYNRQVIVWNPSTGFYKQILSFSDFMLDSLYGFGYDNSTDDYFLVLIGLIWVKAIIQAFSVKTNSCDFKYVNAQYRDLGYHYRHGVFLNNSLHWLVTTTDTSFSNDTSFLVVIAYDLLEKSLSEIPLSPELAKPVLTAEGAPKFYHVRVLGGCLSLCYKGGRRDRAEIWVMKEYKVQSSWTKAFVVTDCDIPCIHFYPIRFIERGGVLGSNGNGRLMTFNAEGKLLEHHKYGQEIKNVRKDLAMYRESEYKNIQIYFEMYRESLLSFPSEQLHLRVTSLPHGFKEANEVEEATKDEEEEASGLSLHSVKSLTCEFKEATEEVEAAEDEEEETTEDEDASDDKEDESEEASTEDGEATEDEEATEDVEATVDEEEEATEVEEATDHEEVESEKESNKDEEATEDEEEESSEDDYI